MVIGVVSLARRVRKMVATTAPAAKDSLNNYSPIRWQGSQTRCGAGSGRDSVVPLGAERMLAQLQGVHLGVGDGPAGGEVAVQPHGLHVQTRGSRGAAGVGQQGDEGAQGLARPVDA